jgi:hypothetical protein
VSRRFGRSSQPCHPPPESRAFGDELEVIAVLAGKMLAQRSANRKLSDIREAEFRVFSQFGDDGIVDYVAERLDLPYEQQRFVEIGVEDYSEANTRFLLVNRNWSGLIIDRDDAHLRRLERSPLLWRHDLNAVASVAVRDNVNELLTKHGFDRDLGLLSIDVDGIDYWLWEAVEVSPAFVILEYNSLFGSARAVTVPYSADFDRTSAHYSNLYFGASLPALNAVAQRKGYSLVGANSAGNNAYFVRQDLAGDLPAPTVAEAYVWSRIRESRDRNGNLTYLSGRDRVTEIEDLEVWDLELERLVRVGDL